MDSLFGLSVLDKWSLASRTGVPRRLIAFCMSSIWSQRVEEPLRTRAASCNF
jgi:hypothetical protein